MNILIIGDDVNAEECRQKFGASHVYTSHKNHKEAKAIVGQQDVIFDFVIEKDISQMSIYRHTNKAAVFLNTAKITLKKLASILDGQVGGALFGFAGLPSFLNREILETSLHQINQTAQLEDVCRKLNTKFQIVEDRVGLVTPRVICMIINEAYFTVEEGTATREDIDMAMKLGTNYPYGPFEWAKKIGVKNVVGVLKAVYDDTKDARYKTCSLLQRESKLN